MENNGSSNTNNKKWNGKKKFKYNPNRNSSNLNNTNKPVVDTSVNKTSNSNLSNNRQNNNINSNQKNNSINNRNGYNNSKHYNKNYHSNRNKVEKSVEEYEKEYIEKKKNLSKEYPICPVCKESIYIIETSIKHLATGENAHFDCIIKELTESNELEKNEKVVYLGSGTFGIIQDRVGNKNDRMKFFVRKRIAYEDRKEKEINIDTDTEEEEIFDV